MNNKRRGIVKRTIEKWKSSGNPHLVKIANDVEQNMRCTKAGKYFGSYLGTDKKMASAYPIETAQAGILTIA